MRTAKEGHYSYRRNGTSAPESETQPFVQPLLFDWQHPDHPGSYTLATGVRLAMGGTE
jgi:hypothetical protein